MKNTITVSELNRNGSAALRLAERAGLVCVTDHGRPVAYIVPAERMEALAETLEILGNADAMRWIRDAEAGRLTWHNLDAAEEHEARQPE